MTARTLPSLAQALGSATDLDAALVSLAGAVAENDRDAQVALLRFDPRQGLVRERLAVRDGRVERAPLETSLEQLPRQVLRTVQDGGTFGDVGEEPPAYARLFKLGAADEGATVALRGIKVDGQLVAVLSLVEPKRVFGTRAVERVAPLAGLFELALARFHDREVRDEARKTLEEVTQRVHGEYLTRLSELERQVAHARLTASQPVVDPAEAVAREREEARRAEESRRTLRKLAALEHQLTASVGQLEQAHIELHRRSEALRSRTRTLYLLDRVMTLAAETKDPHRLSEGLLALVGDDMQSLRCSLFLVGKEPGTIYLAAARGLAPHVQIGKVVAIGHGVAGRVAERREPMLVVDAVDAKQQPLLGDDYLTTGSFISFPLVLHDELVGVVNLTNRAQQGLFVEEDVERVRMLGLVISLIASEARLPDRLHGSIRER
ncbi:MAG: GAF domain-containing protein [Gemmatimonadetes bacterium]|nr:GAF domain-containing protein [Gemmatimonadota bacterium]MBP7549757.1 GAF domain-containing protein [Gemmatimonadaceae bacterium]